MNCFQNCIFTWHSQSSLLSSNACMVVNCFQNCIFTWHSQSIRSVIDDELSCELLSELYFYLAFAVGDSILHYLQGCELLSELYFYLAFAVHTRRTYTHIRLWIAFRIVFLLGIRSQGKLKKLNTLVVNCFQNCIFTWHSQ